MNNNKIGRILVVDDEVELKNILVEALISHGYEAVGFTTGNEALTTLREQSFDILITDLMMPGMDGITLVRETERIDPNLVCIMMTGQGTIQTAVDAMKVGAFDYVLKPFRLQTMLPVLTRAINARHLRLENVQLREAVAIHELCETIAFTLDPQTVLSKLADAALVQSQADEVSILLPTSNGTELYVATVRGEKRERLLGERIPLHEGISSWVARERTPLILNGEVQDERFQALWPRADIRSAVSVPMQVANKLVGVINLNMTNRMRPFTLGQMKGLSILAGTAAAALESAALYIQVKQAEKNYRSIFENAVEGFFQSTLEGRFLTVNKAMAQILGYDSPDELITVVTDIGQQLYVDQTLRAEVNQTLAEGGVVQGFEFQAYRKNREKIWLSLNIRAVPGGTGLRVAREGTAEDITKRKRAEAEKLLIFEIIQGVITTPNLDELLKLVHASICKLLDAENCFVALHDPATNLMHYEFWADKFAPVPESRLLGTDFSSYVVRHSQPLLFTKELIGEMEARGEVVPDGKVALSWLGVPLRTAAGTIGALVLQHYETQDAYTQRDLEFLSSVGDQIAFAIERKRSEEALTESESRKDAILNSALDCVVTIDHQGTIVDFNPAAEQTFGYTRDSAMGKKMVDLLVPPSFRSRHDHGFSRFLATGCSSMLGKRIEVSALRSDGSEIPVELTITVIGDLPRPTFTAFIRDLTARKLAEAELQRSEERYRDLVENARDMIYEHDLNGVYTSTNNAGQHLTGYTLAETLKLNIADTVAPECLEKAREMLRRKLAGETVTAYELDILTKDGGRIPVEVNTRLVYQNGVPLGVQGIARDITERKNLEQALHESEEQLRQSQKLEAIGQLAGGVAHDFNNLLTAINGYSALALRRVGEDHPIASYLEEIKKAGDRAANLTRQLLAFGRKQILQPLAINLNDIVGDMIKLLKRLIGEDIQLVTKPGADLNQVKADPGQIEQVLVNLVVNARDAMPRGGIVTIETANTTLDNSYATRHVGVTPGDYVMMAISDTGTGMDNLTQTRIFEPFFTTKEKGKGTGLGLSTVYGIVRQSGGNIWVYSEPGKGTTFKIYLPLIQEDAHGLAQAAEYDPIKSGTETVLLVEDDEMVRKLATELLAEGGYVVLAVNGGEEAIVLCKEYSEVIHLLITDVVMPKFSGKEVAEQLLTIHPETKVLFMSGYTDEAIVHHGIVDSGIAFIQKPFSKQALTRKIREVLDGANGH